MKSRLFTYCAAAALIGATAPHALADDQATSAPAGTRYAPPPSVEEELVYLRDIIALQTLRLDEAEQTLARQNAVIEQQARRLESMERTIVATQAVQQTLAASAGLSIDAPAPGGEHVVQSGDTLAALSRRYGASVRAIAEANSLRAPYPLRVGQRLAIPGAAGAASARVAAAEPPAAEEKITPPQQQGRADDEPAASRRVASADATSGPSAAERPDVTARAIDEQSRRDDAPERTDLPQEVGIRQEEEERPYLAIISDVGGILTPKGSLYAEPAIDFTTTSDNRFFFQGIEILDAILIGAIEATDSDRRAVTESMALRYGVTNRLEIDGRISYLQRDDTVTGVAIDDTVALTRNLKGSGFGDVEVGAHYQLNNGRRFPYAIANIRAKAPTGRGPFEVDRTPQQGIETELATGSGYWTIEPSLTFILPSDPAVIFANIGYQSNLPTSPNVNLGENALIRRFDPGDAIRTSLGVGLSLNERLSVNFGYDQSQFFSTKTILEQQVRDQIFDADGEPVLDGDGNPTFSDPYWVTAETRQPSTTVGSFLFGGSYAVNDRLRINLNTAFGATDEAPDMRVSLRAQIRLFD